MVVSTLASIFGNLGHMGLMGFGALLLLNLAGEETGGSAGLFAALTVGSAVLIPVCRYLEGVFSHIGAYGILARLRVHLFEQISRIAPACLVDRRKGDLVNIAVSDIETLEFFFAHTIGPMFTVILLPVTTLAVAAHYGFLYFLVLLPVFLMVSVVLPAVAMKAGRPLGMRYRESLGELNSLILESVYGICDVQSFGQGQARMDKVLAQNKEVNRAAHGMTLHRQTVAALPNFFVYLARILILASAGTLIASGRGNSVGAVVVSFVAAASFSSSFSLTFVVTHLLETYAAAERFFIIEDTPVPVAEATEPVSPGPVKEVSFEDVAFSYPGTGEETLQGVSLTVRSGEKVGIAGESGAGKSTLLRLLLRFYEPNEGRICLNGQDISTVSLSELHRRVGMLEQETYLFDRSIAENIALGKPGASREEIETAARRASIHDFIQTLPEGYDTPMGQMQARLSGGEHQRVGIARILLSNPDVLVLDEPTSALDALHENEILQTLEREYVEKTIILISHRMSTLRICDRILRLEEGRLHGNSGQESENACRFVSINRKD